jgi:APA family basic amino acid/polyamine antiporter
MVPVAGSAYTYTYAVMGEVLAWMVGWALILEYAVAASAVSVGWSGYFVGLLNSLGLALPAYLTVGPYGGGIANIPALIIACLVTALLVIGTTESARVNSVLVAIKVAALTMFIVVTLPITKASNFHPFIPNGWGTMGVVGAASSIFFAYVGFDAVSTAAEETKNPQRNVPIGLMGSLAICTIFYILAAAGAAGAMGAQPLLGSNGVALAPSSTELTSRCQEIAMIGRQPIVCSREALAHVLRDTGHVALGNLLGVAVFIAMPSVILMMLYGQTRIFFVMARDGLLPEILSTVHPTWKTPHIITMLTGVGVAIAAAFFPVGQLANISNSGTLFAFMLVAISVLVLRRTQPDRKRPFRTPAIWVVAPLTVLGTLGLFVFLPTLAKLVFPIWSGIGLLVYFAYGRRHSHVGRGLTEVHESDAEVPAPLGITPK